ncbi:A24 family peptidase [Adlercreutzia sp. R25]|uniref:A24 family peptidase n=1 Tax=Adlercreutzia shanghongiae TaxID=3111773 RepID=A0ABU6IVB2_9ACTN|nr:MULTISPECIES: A24 family peptidase [unclassified Adlercreutzia]MEC4272035.1 A24 family peptidase [Adlercreutzia sp. R25]MEC4293766.1 A24 family peptidase [Adlercreutzia sp. R22]
MTYVSVITLVAYVLVLALLAVVSVIDVRSRRVPNGLAAAIGLLWAVWRLVLGFAGKHMGLGFKAELLGPAPDVVVPPGFSIGGISLASGILGAVVLGGGLLVLTTVYEAITHKESFGGGDIKLMTVLGLFLGMERGVICLLAACVLSVVYVLGRALLQRLVRRSAMVASDSDASRRGLSKTAGGSSKPFLSGAIQGVASERDRDSLLAGTMPFAPFITLGALIAFVA